VTDAAGDKTTTSYDADGNVTQMTDEEVGDSSD
jgi:YD repeat-containing protein